MPVRGATPGSSNDARVAATSFGRAFAKYATADREPDDERRPVGLHLIHVRRGSPAASHRHCG